MNTPLPEDIYILIFQYLSLRDVLAVRTVCKRFKEMTHSRMLWLMLLRRGIRERNIPITPHTDTLDGLNGIQIEKLVANSLTLHRNWTGPSPTVRQRRHITAIPEAPAARIISLHFITLEERSCLLSFSLADTMLTMQCWDLHSLSCMARRTVQWFGGYAVNSDLTNAGLVAIKTPQVEVLGFDSSASSPNSALITLNNLSTEVKTVLFLTGTTLIFRSINDEIKMVDITRPSYEVQLDEDRQPLVEPDVFQAIVCDDYAIVVRTDTLALYSLDTFRNETHPPSVPLSPLTVHRFHWKINSCLLAERRVSHPNDVSIKPSSINILIRFSSVLPWPVNLLHHFILHSNPTEDSDSEVASLEADSLPYHFPPVLAQTIAAPVRLFANTDMALGPYGTAVWLDSHTESFYHRGEVGQRLAGIMLNSFLTRDEDGEPDRGDDEWFTEDQSIQRAASMVFGAQEADDWTRVVIDEEGGRIAVGSGTGEIIIDDYAQNY